MKLNKRRDKAPRMINPINFKTMLLLPIRKAKHYLSDIHSI